MAINLLSLQPHKVSRDLSGYMTYLYGPSGVGKTTFGSKMPKPLLLACEKGYSAIPGIIAQDVTSWTDIKQILRELKRPEVKEAYSSIIIDTVDIAASLCEKYICNQLGIENIGDGGWTTNGWSKVKKEWEVTFRTIAMEGYAIVFISHAKDKVFKRKDGTEYHQIVPSCSTAYNEIIKNMVDIMAYVDIVDGERLMVLRSKDDSIDCKSRFKYMQHTIPFGYKDLTDALNQAIDREANETNNQFITNEKEVVKKETVYDYDGLMKEFGDIVNVLMSKNQSNGPKITVIVDKYLGKGKKVSDATPNQAEFIFLILEDIKEEFKSQLI